MANSQRRSFIQDCIRDGFRGIHLRNAVRSLEDQAEERLRDDQKYYDRLEWEQADHERRYIDLIEGA